MPTILQRLISKDWRPGRAAAAGLAATVAYSVAMEADEYLPGKHFHDSRFLPGLLGDAQATSKRSLVLAWTFHFFTGAMLGEVYAAVLKRFLPGPDWLKGAIFGEAFVLAVWPLTPLADRFHPMIKSGKLPQLANWTSFRQNVLRHLLFGLTLGLLYRASKPE